MTEENKKDMVESEACTPSQAVEKTVADLKKKIQEISNEATPEKEEKHRGIDLPIDEEKIKEFKEETAETLNRSVEGAKEMANDFVGNVDFAKTLQYLKQNAVNAVEQAKASLDEFGEREDVKKTIAAAKEKANDLGEKAKGLLDDEKKEMVQEKLKEVGEKVKETSAAVGAYLQSDEVQDSIRSAKKTARDFFERCVESVRDFSEKK